MTKQTEIQSFEVHHFEDRDIPGWVKILFGGILYLSATYLSFITLVQLFAVFQLSIAAGLVLIFTPLGWLFFGPGIFLAWSAPSMLMDMTNSIQNNWEYFMKIIFGYLGAIVIPYIVFFLLMFILGVIMAVAGIN